MHENLEYSTDSFTNAIQRYSESDCSGSVLGTLNITGEIVYLDAVQANDGVDALRADFAIDTGGVEPIFEGVAHMAYRMTDTEIYFGIYQDGVVPEINYGISYHKQ